MALEQIHTVTLATTEPPPWHALDVDENLEHLDSSIQGLSDEAVAERQVRYGPNTLPSRKPISLAAIIFHQLKSPLIYILIAAGTVSLALREYKEAFFIFLVVVINAVLGAYQENKAERSAEALQSLLKIYARVRRNGYEQTLTSEELVPGDIVLLESGLRVPADVRLLQTSGLQIDEALLTGESLAVEKRCELLAADLALSERTNMAFAGTTTTAGRAVAVVVATGANTELGRIAGATSAVDTTLPPLMIRMERFARQISLVVLAATALLAVLASLRGIPPLEIFFLAVALAVSAIPEGLPLAITVVLSIATLRMARRNVIVRRLAAVEGLGSCTYIASDKTGTLTLNQQVARIIVLPEGHRLAVSGEGYAPHGAVQAVDATTTDRLTDLATVAALCNEGSLRAVDGTWEHSGDAVDIALLALAHKLGVNPQELRREARPTGVIPFESELRFAATYFHHNGRNLVAVKGATETVLGFCDAMQTAAGPAPLDAETIENTALELAADGYRVLALALGEGLPPQHAAPTSDDLPPLTLIGLVGLIDPLRPEVRDAVARCRDAGIAVAMITGDHPATAMAIANDLGITTTTDTVVTGSDLAAVGDPDSPAFHDLVRSAHVFARVSPLQKLQIVEALIALGHYVAVTGDGVNDAPALRAGNIGVAMGSGTDVAKDMASIIVTDDNFASITAGVEGGRHAYANIRKVVYLLISTGAAEVVLFILAVTTGMPLPLFAVQLLWLNLVTNGIQHVGLAFEAGEPNAMRRPPRRPGEGVFNPLMVQQTLLSGATMAIVALGVWWYLLRAGYEEAAARNLLLLLMVLFENFHVFNCRSEYSSAFRVPLRNNPILLVGVAAALGLHLLSMHIPLAQSVLGVAPVSLAEFGTFVLLAMPVLIVMELFKLARR
jgi:P-type Ca2+ transporter type 2C